MTPGLKAVADVLETQLGSLGLRKFGEDGEPFDPTRHEAVTHVVSPDVDRLTCTEILSRGYRVGDRLLRAARVTVAGPPSPGGGVEQPAGGDGRGEHRDPPH
ncbi:nucleotide exchange factor GrpE [Streptomyces chiangmaiensis]